eukprot:6251350-Prymnesium_polylepis.1
MMRCGAVATRASTMQEEGEGGREDTPLSGGTSVVGCAAARRRVVPPGDSRGVDGANGRVGHPKRGLPCCSSAHADSPPPPIPIVSRAAVPLCAPPSRSARSSRRTTATVAPDGRRSDHHARLGERLDRRAVGRREEAVGQCVAAHVGHRREPRDFRELVGRAGGVDLRTGVACEGGGHAGGCQSAAACRVRAVRRGRDRDERLRSPPGQRARAR